MSDKKFNIVFKGEIISGANMSAVQANVGRLFKANEKVLNKLFSGDSVVIKKGVDQAAAMKYRALMKKAGAICYAQALEPASDDIKTPPSISTVKPSPEQASKPENQDEISDRSSGLNPSERKAEVSTDSFDDNHHGVPSLNKEADGEKEWSIAPVGSVIGEPVEIENIEIPDIEGINLAPPGADLVDTLLKPEFDDLPDTSSIDLAPVGADVADPIAEEVFDIPDVSGIDIAEVGSDVADPVEHDVFNTPDLSGIGLAEVGSDVADPKPDTPELLVDTSHLLVEPPS